MPAHHPTRFSQAILVLALSLATLACSSPEERAAAFMAKANELYAAGDYVKTKIEVRNALQVQPKNAPASYLLATLLEREQDVKGMLGSLQAAIDADPDHVEARTKLGTYFVVGRRPREARDQADIVLRLAPERAESRVLSAKVLLLEGKPAEALAEARKAAELAPSDPQAASYLALLQARGGDLDGAMASLDTGIAAAGPADREYLRNARISIWSEASRPEAVQAELERMVADYPANSMYPMALAEIYAGQGRVDDAARLIGKLIAADPENAGWRVELATLLTRAKRPEDAEASLRKSIAESPQSGTLKLALGGFYESQGRRSEALAAYAEAARAAPDQADRLAARNRMALLNAGVDDVAARRIADEILAEVPDNPDALLTRAAYRIQDGAYQDAIADLRGVLVRQPKSTRALLTLARAHVLGGEGNLAEDYYRKLLEIAPEDPTALRELGALAANRGATAEAESLLRAALSADPRDADASRTLVESLLRQKDYGAAADEAARIAAAGDTSGIAEYQLGIALASQGRNDDAIAAFRASLNKNPGARPPLDVLVALYIKLGRLADAESLLGARIGNDAGDRHARLLLAEVYAAGNRSADAATLYRGILAEDKAAIGAWVGLAGLQPAGSSAWVQVISDGLAANPGAPELALALGGALQRQGDYAAAIGLFEKTLAARDTDLVASNLAALLLDYRSDAASHRRALELAQRFAGADAHPFSKAVLGWAYYRNGDYAAAVPELERAVAANPRLPQLRYYLGMAYLRNENPAGAQQELRQAVELAKDPAAAYTGLAEARAELARLGGG